MENAQRALCARDSTGCRSRHVTSVRGSLWTTLSSAGPSQLAAVYWLRPSLRALQRAPLKASVWVAAQCQFEHLASNSTSLYVREIARDAAVLGAATLRLDDALSSAVMPLSPQNEGMIAGSMSGDKADHRRVSCAAGADAAPGDERRLVWFCPARGVLGEWAWADEWSSSRAAQGYIIRAVAFPRGAAAQRLASATGWAGQASAQCAEAMFEELLRMPPFLASSEELAEWRFSGAGFRHFLPNTAAALGVHPHVYNELGRWARSESGARRVHGTSGKGAAMAGRYATDARSSLEMRLRRALLQALHGASAGQNWLDVWPRGPDWGRMARIVNAQASSDDRAAVTAFGGGPTGPSPTSLQMCGD